MKVGSISSFLEFMPTVTINYCLEFHAQKLSRQLCRLLYDFSINCNCIVPQFACHRSEKWCLVSLKCMLIVLCCNYLGVHSHSILPLSVVSSSSSQEVDLLSPMLMKNERNSFPFTFYDSHYGSCMVI